MIIQGITTQPVLFLLLLLPLLPPLPPHLWHNWSHHLPLHQLIEIKPPKPFMPLDILGSIFEAPVSSGEVGHQQLFDEGFGIAVDPTGEGEVALEDLGGEVREGGRRR